MLIAGAEAGGTGGFLQMLLPFVLMFAVFYFLLIRPQQKKQKQRNSMLSALKKGDKIVTIGGLHGTIVEITDDTIVLRVNDVTKMTFDRSAISQVVSAEESASAS
ncbi:preprotein translocase subunit YajC [Paenibacillus alvei]|uniref:Preprotein translocase subunit YajC n=1 Tax=Paenibacillus alvei TaxID=44250 RepID=A0AAP7DII7_PAEAL|nr:MULTISPECIES: preprotein translocase subunit YajC [Paenibacillus]EJW17085.1 putative membrane protein [Paenibacillus alvei DSM 29]MBG9737445.1 preprotein translocase subunit YajC [Paenibacillus alvei]MBG9746013.1 preprotein translocase subunit YajC [Paenibacillus alvei]MCY7483944.1 preprotein translocase subunit YajC [Paenibacillus alvei]MCY9541560.1 preprotein translocase subunit YajC [Paenibacillus alvei]